MVATPTYPSESPTRVWLRQHPEVIAAARGSIEAEAGATPLADGVLANPALLVTGIRSVLIQSLEHDAPPGVTEDLLVSYRVISARVRTVEALPFVRARLSDLRGLRDANELGPKVRDGLEQAPDDGSLEALTRLSRITDALPASDEMVVTDQPDGSVVFTTDPSRLVDPSGPGTVEPGTDRGGRVIPDTGPLPGTTEPGRVAGTPDGLDLAGAGLPAGAEVFAHDVGVDVAKSLGLPDPVTAGADAARAAFERFMGSHSGAASHSSGGLFTALGQFIGGAVGFVLGGPGGAALGAGIGARAGAIVDHAIDDPHFDATTALACIVCGPTCIPCVLAAESGNTGPHAPGPVT